APFAAVTHMAGLLALAMPANCNPESLHIQDMHANLKTAEPFVFFILKNKWKQVAWKQSDGIDTLILGNRTNLVSLELQKNMLSGPVPASLGNIKTLRSLDVVLPVDPHRTYQNSLRTSLLTIILYI
ncbi:hypothetical protein EJB05_27768, partial [Eragrostis curvula]